MTALMAIILLTIDLGLHLVCPGFGVCALSFPLHVRHLACPGAMMVADVLKVNLRWKLIVCKHTFVLRIFERLNSRPNRSGQYLQSDHINQHQPLACRFPSRPLRVLAPSKHSDELPSSVPGHLLPLLRLLPHNTDTIVRLHLLVSHTLK